MYIICGVVFFFIVIVMVGSAGYKQRMQERKRSKENARKIFQKKAMKLFDKYQEQLDWIDNK